MTSRIALQQTQRAAIAVALSFSLFLPVLAGSSAASDHRREMRAAFPSVTIDNFGQVNDHLYRGSQPSAEGFRQLASIGVKTVIDLRGDFEKNAKAQAEEAGLHYINLPLNPKITPQAADAEKFLSIVNDQANWPVYVHCAGGRHRTGSMVAVYRMSVDGWDVDKVYQEMKDYDFYTSGGHGCYKNFVFNYFHDLQAHNATPATPAEAKDAVSKDVKDVKETVNTEPREQF